MQPFDVLPLTAQLLANELRLVDLEKANLIHIVQ
jgi:hypothetical protein